MKKTLTFLGHLTFHLIITAALQAEIIVLKDGTRLNGEVLDKNDTRYLVNVQVSDSITEERSIPRTDVDKVLRSPTDERDYRTLEQALAAADLQKPADYQSFINRNVQPFIEKHKFSKYRKDAEALKQKLKKQAKTLEEGGVKVGDRVYGKQEAKENALELAGASHLAKMKELAKSGQFGPALDAYTRIATEAPATKPHREAYNLAQSIIAKYSTTVKAALEKAPDLINKRRQNLRSLPKAEKARALSVIKKKKQSYEQQLKGALEEGTPWLPLDPYYPKPMQSVLKTLNKAQQKLDAIDFTDIPDTGDLFRQGWNLAQEVKEPELAKIIKQLKKYKVPEKHITTLIQRFRKYQAEQQPAGASKTPAKG